MRKRIQKSMMFILIAILVPIYLIMSVVVYQRNLKILEGEIKQEAAYIRYRKQRIVLLCGSSG